MLASSVWHDRVWYGSRNKAEREAKGEVPVSNWKLDLRLS